MRSGLKECRAGRVREVRVEYKERMDKETKNI